jgi:hypothetical protein
MNIKTTTLFGILLLAVAGWLNADEPGKAKAASPEFERMKTLVGTWAGKSDMGQGPVDVKITYRLIAAGTVVEERIAPGTPMEMLTMYYDKAGKLAATHYCVMGNQPAMALKAADKNSITLDFDATSCTIDPAKEAHMHGMTLRFDDADTITSTCKAMMDGKEMPACTMTLKRVKTEAASAQ